MKELKKKKKLKNTSTFRLNDPKPNSDKEVFQKSSDRLRHVHKAISLFLARTNMKVKVTQLEHNLKMKLKLKK